MTLPLPTGENSNGGFGEITSGGYIASLIETSKINGIEPFAYLKATLEAITAGHPKNRIDDLLPWNFTPSS